MAGWNGSGTFSRTYNWTSDKNNGIKITSVRHDGNDQDFVDGINNCITIDGQNVATANIPFGGRKITSYGSSSAPSDRTDVSSVGNVQDGVFNWIDGTGTVDVITATYAPAITALVDGQVCRVRATGANTSTTPTFSPNGLTARTIVKEGGAALVAGDIAANNHELILVYNLGSTRWELLNPVDSGSIDGFTTGDVKVTLKASADTGWVMGDDGTIGNGSSGGSTRANADTEALFTLLWTNVTNTYAPVSTGRGASAAADFAANKTITLTKALGRTLAVAGSGSGLTARALGETLGEESHTMTEAELFQHTHAATVTDGGHAHVQRHHTSGAGTGTNVSGSAFDASPTNDNISTASATTGISVANANTGSSTAFNVMQPTSFFNIMVKL